MQKLFARSENRAVLVGVLIFLGFHFCMLLLFDIVTF
jgi:hypothetical protein